MTQTTKSEKAQHPAFAVLNGYKNKCKLIEAKKELLADVYEKATNITAMLKQDVVSGGNGQKDTTAKAAVRAADLKWEIDAMTAEAFEEVSKILRVINQMQDEKEKLVLTYRYANGLSWKSVERNMNYTYDNLKKIHRKAARSFWAIYCQETERVPKSTQKYP